MRLRSTSLALLVGLLAIGCTSETASVSGIVTLDNKPLTLGTVTFHPANGGPAATGSIDDSGHYRLVVGAGERLPPGEYVATVVATEPVKEPVNPKIAPTPGKLITPKNYGDSTKSDLKVSVKNGSNSIDLKLISR